MIRLGINPQTGTIHALTDEGKFLCDQRTSLDFKIRVTGYGTIEHVECEKCHRLAKELLK